MGVLQAKAESDSMQHTLPFEEKQIEQSNLEAAARKEATLPHVKAAGQTKIIDSKAELERQKNLSDAERIEFEPSVLNQNPILIQKIMAESWSDQLQIMMEPMDGKNFIAAGEM
jgi:hypothetical protein